jgi:hypothetical protein
MVVYKKAMSSEKLTERSLTEAMGRMLAADPAAAGRFEAALMGQLARKLPPNRRARCLVEHDYYLGLMSGWRKRRADFMFCSFNYRRVVVVEAKLSAPIGHMQVADAQKIDVRDVALLPGKADCYVAVIANRALVPRDKTKDRWLGATTWHGLLPGIAHLAFADLERAFRWRSLIARYRHAGSFGPDPLETRSACALLDAAGLRAVQDADRRLRDRPWRVRAVPGRDNSERVVFGNASHARMRFEVTKIKSRTYTVDLRLSDGGPATVSLVTPSKPWSVAVEATQGPVRKALSDLAVAAALGRPPREPRSGRDRRAASKRSAPAGRARRPSR